MSTARDLIKGSLRLLGAIATGETPPADEQADALSVLNDMLDSWSLESLLIYSKVIETFALVSGQQTRTIGSSGNFNTARPLSIEHATVQVVGTSPTNEIPLEILNFDQWAGITIKGTTSTLPQKLYYDPSNPLGTIYLWPIPTVANNIVLYSWKPLTSIATVDTAVAVPPGYAKLLRYGLAIELAPEYSRTVTKEIAAGYLESKENVKRMNSRPLLMQVDPSLMGSPKSFNWLTGE